METKINSTNLNESLRQGEEYVKKIVDETQAKAKQGEEQIRHVISDVDKKLRENPWPIVAGVAATCVLVGFIMGSRKGN